MSLAPGQRAELPLFRYKALSYISLMMWDLDKRVLIDFGVLGRYEYTV